MLQAFHIFHLNIFKSLTDAIFSPHSLHQQLHSISLNFSSVDSEIAVAAGWVTSRAREKLSAQWPTQFTWQGHGEIQVERALFTLKIRKIQRCSSVRTQSSSQWAERIHSLDLQLKHLYASPFPPKGGCTGGKKPSNINEPKLFNSGNPSLCFTPDLFQVLLPGFLRKFWKELARGDLANKGKI